MDMDVLQDSGTVQADKIKETYETLQVRNKILQEEIEFLQKENTQIKQKHHILKSSLLTLNEILERNAKLFNQLCDDTRSALKVGRISMVSTPQSPGTISCSMSPIPGTSKVCAPLRAIDNVQFNGVAPNLEPINTVDNEPAVSNHIQPRLRRKMHIEPVNMDEIQQMAEEAAMENLEMQVEEEPTGRLTTILEETSTCVKELCVKLERLPREVINVHLQKETSNVELNGTLNISGSFSIDQSFLSSTPFKLQTMRKLGLKPTSELNDSLPQFVSDRKKRTNSASTSKQSTNIILKKERLTSPRAKVSVSPKRGSSIQKESRKRSGSNSLTSQAVKKKKSSPLKKLKSPKKEKLSPLKENILLSPKKSPSYSRPQRKAKPKVLKEESLVTKKRRP